MTSTRFESVTLTLSGTGSSRATSIACFGLTLGSGLLRAADGQLAATRSDIDPAALTDRARQREFIREDALKGFRGFGARGDSLVTGCRIQGNQINLRW